MAKINLQDATSLTNETSFVTLFNENNAELETVGDTFLSLDGSTPNSMGANLDMNSYRIINLPTPTLSNDPVRLQDMVTYSGGGTIATFPTTSAALATLITDETGSGSLVFGTSPTIATPTITNPTVTTGTFTNPAVTTGTFTNPAVTTGTFTNPAVTTGTFSAPVLTSPTVTTKISPTTNDGAPLGDTTHNFSDLFMAAGAVINWNAGDVTLTHSTDALAFAGAASGYTFDNPFGYATGTGAAVTQGAGSGKGTAVVQNKVTGTITMNNAALAAATIANFTFTNSFIAATDVLVLNHLSGGTIGAYTLNSSCGSGSALICIRNNTAGSLSDAIVISYVLIKGAVT